MQLKKDMNKKLGLILASIFLPFLTFIFSIISFEKNKLTPVFLFFVFYGFTFSILDNSDSSRYLDQYLLYSDLTFNQTILNYFSGENSDIYILTISYLTSIFSDNPRIFFLVCSIIYNYFFLSTIKIVLENISISKSIFSKIVALTLIFYVPFFFFNSIRFYTAFFIYFYCLTQIFLNKDKHYYYLALVTPLIHFSFILPLILLMTTFFFIKNRWFYVILFLASLFYNASLSTINFSLFEFNNAISSKANSYLSIEGQQGLMDRESELRKTISTKFIILTFVRDYHFLFSLLLFFLLFIKKKSLKLFDKINPYSINLILMNLSMWSLSKNISEGYRFQGFFVFSFLIFILITNSKTSNLYINWIFKALIYSLFIYSILTSYVFLPTLNLNVLFSNWLIEIFKL